MLGSWRATIIDVVTGEGLRGYLEYLQDLGIYDLYRTPGPTDPELGALLLSVLAEKTRAASAPVTSGPNEPAHPFSSPLAAKAKPETSKGMPASTLPPRSINPFTTNSALVESAEPGADSAGPPVTATMAPLSFNHRAPLPEVSVEASQKAAVLQSLPAEIGDCTRCPLAYAGRHSIVFADGDPNARLMFVGEGPGADEDASGLPFVGKAGQLLNNMISAMGLKREQVYIANVVMCRPPKNRAPEPVEANTCSQFLLRQIDVVQPKVIVALGSTAATYLLGVKQSLAALRGQWHDVRGARCAVTYHPAYLLRDPKMKGEAWKDLQRVMTELKLRPGTQS